MPAVTPELLDAYRRDGAVVLRGLLEPHEVATLAEGVERNLREPGELALDSTADGGPGRFFEDFCNWRRIPEYWRVIRASAIGPAAAALTGSERVRLFHDHTLVKEAGTEDRSPWHQDQPYYCIDGRQVVSFWLPLDPVGRENTLELAAGSHAQGIWYMPRSFIRGTPMVFEEGALEEVPDIDADRDRWRILGWELEPGDAVAFHMLTLHQAAGSATRRRAFSVRVIGDDVRFAPRPHRTSPPFPGLDERLAPGAPLDDPLFPAI